jgi:hypothetical protein
MVQTRPVGQMCQQVMLGQIVHALPGLEACGQVAQQDDAVPFFSPGMVQASISTGMSWPFCG